MSETRSAYLQETKRHGSVLFPFNIYPCTIPRDFPSVALHWHKSMELVYVKKGAGQVQAGMRWMDAAAESPFSCRAQCARRALRLSVFLRRKLDAAGYHAACLSQ